jgi:N-acetylmuramoyl-L-alanine amidase
MVDVDPTLEPPPTTEEEECARRARITIAELVAWYRRHGLRLDADDQLHDWIPGEDEGETVLVATPEARMREAANLMVAAGLRVQYYSGWTTRGRPYSFNPTAGLIEHHTASDVDIDSVLANGRSDLPGPLCHYALHKDGTVVLIAAGYANHAGASVAGAPGNGTGWGIEATGPVPTGATGVNAFPQYDQYTTMVACILRADGWDTRKVFGHKESCDPPGRKGDPYFNMDDHRAAEAAAMTSAAPAGEDLSIMDPDTKSYLDNQFRLVRVGDVQSGATDTHDFSSIEGVGRQVAQVAKEVTLIRVGDVSGGEADTHDFSSVEGVGRQVAALAEVVAAQGQQIQQILDLLTAPPTPPPAGGG